MTLLDLKPGQSARVTSIQGTGPVKRRMMDMGITKGVSIQLRKAAPLGDPIEINLLGYELSLRKEDCKLIEVELEK